MGDGLSATPTGRQQRRLSFPAQLVIQAEQPRSERRRKQLVRWPIRNQIIIPFTLIQLFTVTVISLAFAFWAVNRAEVDMQTRLRGVIATIKDYRFPLTAAVLDKMRALSGAHFIAIDSEHHVFASTLSSTVSAQALDSIPTWETSGDGPITDRLRIQCDGNSYFAGKLTLPPSADITSVVVLYSESRWRLARREALRPPLAIGAGMLLLTVGVSIWIAQRIGKRIQTIQDQVARVAAGDFEPIPAVRINDEIRDLSESVNRMCESLRTMAGTIRQTERSNLITQVAGGLAHQLRNSITGARMAVQLHRNRCNAEDKNSLDVALRQLQLIEEHVKGLLRLTRDDNRTFTPATIQEIVDDVTALVSPLFHHNRISLASHCDTGAAFVADADAIRAAVLNLVMNAMEAAGPDGKVQLSAERCDNEVTVRVVDDGPGLPIGDEERIFDPFFSTKPEGIGLGLALAFQAAADHSGHLSALREDDLTVFVFRFVVAGDWAEHDSNEPAAAASVPSHRIGEPSNEPGLDR